MISQPRLISDSRRAEVASLDKTDTSSLGGRNGMYFTYILKSKEFPKTYVGITDDLSRRLLQHNSGLHLYTKRYMPWEIIYSEKLADRIQARKREKYFKSSSGRRWIRYNVFEKSRGGPPRLDV